MSRMTKTSADYWRLHYCEPHPGALEERLAEDLEMVSWYERSDPVRLRFYQRRAFGYAATIALRDATRAAIRSVFT